MTPATSINGGASTDWLKCSQKGCHTFYDTAIPMPHQAYILKDSSPKLGVFGGYGSGKTYTTLKSDEKHILNTPNGETLIGADTLVQLENTLKKDFEKDFPLDFVRRYNRQKNMITFINGHTLYYRHLADEGDIRSYNLTRAHILEASEVKHDSYIQLQTRLRNTAAIEYKINENNEPVIEYNPITKQHHKKEKLNWIQLIVESNPDSGWIKEDFLLKSTEVHVHHDSKQKYHLNPHFVAKDTRSHIIPSKANIHLPEDFIPSLEKGKPEWWVKRYLKGSFDYAEGLVYPHATDQIIDDFEIPKHWPRVISMDYGLNDNTHFIFSAIDFEGERNGKPAVYAFKEIVINDASISQIATVYKEQIRRHLPNGRLYKTPVMDGRSYSQRTRTNDKKTIGTLFHEEGCFFKPAQMDLDARIMRTNDFINNQQMWFFKEGVSRLIEEIKNYKFPDKKLNKSTNTDKPVDKNNHGINALEFQVMELPYQLKFSTSRVYAANQPVKRKDNSWDPLSHNESNGFQGFGEVFEVTDGNSW